LRKNDSTNILEFVDGIEFYYLNTLCEFFNFTYSIVDENQEYGAKLANGEWNGIIGRISRNVRKFDTIFIMISEMIYFSVKISKKIFAKTIKLINNKFCLNIVNFLIGS
jgi:hypothetical protein